MVALLAAAPALAAPTWLEAKDIGSQPGEGELVQTSARPHGGLWTPAVTRDPEDGAGAGIDLPVGADGTNVSHSFTASGIVRVASAENRPPQSEAGPSPQTQQPPQTQQSKPHRAANGTTRMFGAAAVRGGRAVLALRCGRAARCSGLAKLVFQGNYVIGKSRFKISAGSSQILRITIGPAALRLLEGSRDQRLEVRLEGRGVKAQKVVLGL